VYRWSDFHFLDGIFDLCRAAQTQDYLLIVVTNQAGIARGYYSECDFWKLTDLMLTRFAEEGIQIKRVYHCPYHPHAIGRYKMDSPDRKPEPGMLLRASKDFDVDLLSSILVGDKLSDMAAATAAGVGTKILLGPGESKEMQASGYLVAHSLDEVRWRFFSPRGKSEPVRTASDPRVLRQPKF
jgi:D-glycero-D-manno-heptose 1,7-bisphosphate phosphatase